MSYLSLPDQTIPESQKNQEWHEQHCREFAIFSLSDHYNDQKELMLKYLRGYNAELSLEEQNLAKAITCPFGIDTGIEYIVYPLIQGKIEQLVGEFIMRPLPRKAYVVDKKSKNSKYQKKLEMFAEKLMREVMDDIKGDLGFEAQTANPEMELPEDLEEWFETSFKTVAEKCADTFLDIFLDANKNKQKFKDMFVHYCITDRAHAALDKKKGHTSLRPVHPLDAHYDIDPYKVVQDNHEYFFENLFMTENEIYNSFKLTKKQKEIVATTFEAIQAIDNQSGDSTRAEVALKYDGWYSVNNKIARLRLIRGIWKSNKSVRIKKSQNKKTGEDIYKKLPQDYEVQKREQENISEITGDMPRHCVMLGPDLCLDWGLMPERYSYVDTPWECTLPVVSIIRDNPTGSALIKSPAAKLYQLQGMASEVLFEIRLALKQAGASRVLLYDAAQTPKEFTKDGANGLNRVMHHIKRDRLMIINSAEKHFKQNFNQFTSLDLSQKGALNDLFAGLDTIERLADYFVGISPERQGDVGQYQTATGADRAIRGSTARTEVLFSPFDEFAQAVLEKVIRKAKNDYEDGQVLQYIMGDKKTKFLKLISEFFLADFGIYLGNARRDKEMAEKIERAAEQALGNSNQVEMVLGLIDIFEGESAAEKKATFKKMMKQMEKLREQNMKAAQEQAQLEAADKEKSREHEMTMNREDNIKDENVAKIYVAGKNQDTRIKTDSDERRDSAKLIRELEKANEGRQ